MDKIILIYHFYDLIQILTWSFFFKFELPITTDHNLLNNFKFVFIRFLAPLRKTQMPLSDMQGFVSMWFEVGGHEFDRIVEKPVIAQLG